ncbi:MAG TPA: RNA methyltransferase [Woeseiaceae bacterium]|nr:RNA methyltransferase [Woeseiaceae bacterium]
MSPRIVLVGTTHPGNIGAVARAVKNMGLDDLALVSPRYFPHDEANARASGADDLLARARVFDTLGDAVADCVFVAGASARTRAIGWPTLTAREAAARLVSEARSGPVAVVFGPEKAGLSNADLDTCDALLSIPANPGFSSLNLAMAVQVVTYEIRVASGLTVAAPPAEAPPATNGEMEHFYAHLERTLLATGFLDPDNPRLLMRRLRRLFAKARPDQNELNILRGILASVDRLPGPGERDQP